MHTTLHTSHALQVFPRTVYDDLKLKNVFTGP